MRVNALAGNSVEKKEYEKGVMRAGQKVTELAECLGAWKERPPAALTAN